MKKTKIVCTMGPNSNDENIMRQLVKRRHGYCKI